MRKKRTEPIKFDENFTMNICAEENEEFNFFSSSPLHSHLHFSYTGREEAKEIYRRVCGLDRRAGSSATLFHVTTSTRKKNGKSKLLFSMKRSQTMRADHRVATTCFGAANDKSESSLILSLREWGVKLNLNCDSTDEKSRCINHHKEKNIYYYNLSLAKRGEWVKWRIIAWFASYHRDSRDTLSSR